LASRLLADIIIIITMLQALSDFNLALDLGFMTKNRTYTFFKPKYIM
jgi:hypothetical protein